MYHGDEAVALPPKENRILPKSKNCTYVYYFSKRYYDADRGRTVDDRVSVGKLCPDGETMWPNDRWHKVFSPSPSHTPPEPSQVATYRNVGVYLAIRTACERVGLLDAIRDVLPGYQDLLLALVTYLIDETQATGSLFDGWCYHNYCGFPSPVSDAAVADLFRDLIESGVGPDELTGRFCEAYQANVFEGKGRALVLEHRRGDQCGGYGSTHEGMGSIPGLCQALLVDERTSIPLTVADYCGPILDVTETRATMGSIHALGVESLLFVVGGAYATDERAAKFAESGYEFAAEVPRSHGLYRYAMAEKSEVVRLEACYLYRVDCYATVMEAHDCLDGTYDVHLFFDRTRAKRDVGAIHEQGMALLDLASKHVDYTEKLRDAFAPCVTITQTLRDPRTSKDFNAVLNASYYQPQVDNAGYFSLVASPGHASQEILRAYRICQRVKEHFTRYNKSLDSFVSDPRAHQPRPSSHSLRWWPQNRFSGTPETSQRTTETSPSCSQRSGNSSASKTITGRVGLPRV